MVNSIKFKITFLILMLSVVSLIGIFILVFNSSNMQQIFRNTTEQYENALNNNYFSKFDDFLNAIQASSGISQNLGETFYMLRNTLSRQELAQIMEKEYHTAFARETDLLGGGAFYEPNAFYHDVHDFHYFVSKELTTGGIPSENNVRWVGGEWAWDVDTYEEGWYQSALPKGWDRKVPREKRYHWSELYVDTSVDALMVSVCIPIYSPIKHIVGVATIDVSLSTLQKTVSSFPLLTPSTQIAGFSSINNATFAISGSEKFDIVPYPKDSWLNQLTDIKPGQTISQSMKINGEDYSLMAYAHESGIGLAVLMPDSEKYEKADVLQSRNFVTVISVILLMLFIILAALFAISRWIVKPIQKTFTMLEVFAKGDLTQNISTNRKDEIAQMMRMIERAQNSIRQIIMAIGDKTNTLHKNSQDLSSVAAQLTNNAEENVSQTTIVASTTEQMAANINAMASKAELSSTNAIDVASAAEQMSANMSTIAAAIEEMSASINEISSNAGEASKVAGEATAKSQNATSAMNKLGTAAKEIGQVTDVIKKIADKTNLLALNATIEAASAGEAGKGFAVVASEIKELANQSAASADDIAKRIEGIQLGTGEAVTVINDVSEIIAKINNSVDAISNHVGEQTKASNEIASNVAQANTGAKRVANAIGEVAKGGEDIARNAGEAAKGSGVVSQNVAGMAQGAKDSVEGAKQINQSADELAKLASDLKSVLSQFRV
jgi:methyl-accepting chemotaxis protein